MFLLCEFPSPHIKKLMTKISLETMSILSGVGGGEEGEG